MRKQMIQNLVVGIFSAAVLAYGMYFVYQTSMEGTMLLNKITLHLVMSSAMGIKRYAPVKLQGIAVGKVEKIQFSTVPGEDKIYIDMSLDRAYVERIAIANPDPEAPANAKEPDGKMIFSYVAIESEGLLGDNLIQVYAGDPPRAKQVAWTRLKDAAVRMVKADWEKQSKTWDETAAQGEIKNKVNELSHNQAGLDSGHVEEGSYLRAKKGGAGLAGITDSLDPLVGSLTSLLDEAKTQPGLIHALVYDKEMPDRLKGILANVEGILGEVQHGSGNLHTIIYGDDIKKTLNDLSQTMNSVKLAIGNVEKIVGDVEKKKMVDNLQGTLANLQEITRKIKDGEGTVGALITDKSLYQDIQAIMGSAGRSEVVKQAVRYAKNRGEKAQQKEEKKQGQP